MDIKLILAIAAAVLVLVVGPIALIWSFVDSMRRKSSDRPGGGGGISNAVSGAMMEMDRFVRPSVEHTIEAEGQAVKREDDKGGE